MTVKLRIPVATYRFQFNRDSRFRDAGALIPYLYRLGISDIYASPLLKARRGSSHGYDVTDPSQLNPELGTETDFEVLVNECRRHGMGLVLDIVPNHMAVSRENPWWQDVLEKGRASRFYKYFDMDWLDLKGSAKKWSGYRRFFDIGDLVGVRVEDEAVFEDSHSLILRLVADGRVTGLRIDHIDGLYDPLEYLQRLQRYIMAESEGTKSSGFYVVVEKILSGSEDIPAAWPVFGTTGYEFASKLNALFVDGDGIPTLRRCYHELTGSSSDFNEVVYEKKKQVMEELFPDETAALAGHLVYLAKKSKGFHRVSLADMARALVDVTASLSVYRTYIRTAEVAARDRKYLMKALEEAGKRHDASVDALEFMRRLLMLDFPADFTPERKKEWQDFLMRWQQLTGAVMAKGFEDTALYNYYPLLSLNDVGGDPASKGMSVLEFHAWNLDRLRRWPHTLDATSTHDTKRSEDVRARINVLSGIPGEWEEHLKLWMRQNRSKKTPLKDMLLPEPNTELLLYQTLLGAWPLATEEVPSFKKRLKDYMLKAVREAKSYTGWLRTDTRYESSLLGFIDRILEDSADNAFLTDFLAFQKKIAYYGALNSMAQVLLKATSPGMPDFYQGTELWDFSLVDPDNRRPVDFGRRREFLEILARKENEDRSRLIRDMLDSWYDGRIKLYVTYKALNARRECRELFQRGDYLPMEVSGDRNRQVCAFARHYDDRWALVSVPRFYSGLCNTGTLPLGKQVWGDDLVILPGDAPRKWSNVFTGEIITSGSGQMPLATLFSAFPLAFLLAEA